MAQHMLLHRAWLVSIDSRTFGYGRLQNDSVILSAR